MNFTDKTTLFHHLASGKITEGERKDFEKWLASLNEAEYEQFLEDYQNISLEYQVDDLSEDLWDKIEQNINAYESRTHPSKNKYKKLLIPIAASVLIAFGVAAFFLTNIFDSSSVQHDVHIATSSNEIVPGSNKAILKLNDGSKIILEGADEEIISQSGSLITKVKDGQLVYENRSLKDDNTALLQYNTIETPKGGQYHVVLPDGTNVWLNAFSSLKFPTSFKENERKVELIGEAYFEVARNEKKPFIVHTPREIVHVLGTHFNIDSYADEKFSRTTLVEGKVKISLAQDVQGTDARILNPGEQSINNSTSLKVVQTDVQGSLAWKNGEFMFNNEEIERVMRKIARWYDMEVIYPEPIKDRWIWGSISRFEDISEVLKTIELTGSIHFKVEGRRVYVMK